MNVKLTLLQTPIDTVTQSISVFDSIGGYLFLGSLLVVFIATFIFEPIRDFIWGSIFEKLGVKTKNRSTVFFSKKSRITQKGGGQKSAVFGSQDTVVNQEENTNKDENSSPAKKK